MLSRFDPTAPCLVLAPHLEYPLDRGSNILIDKRWRAFSKFVPYLDMLGKNKLIRFEQGRIVSETAFENEFRTAHIAGLRTLFFRSHYWLEKFLTPSFKAQAKVLLQNTAYKTIAYSYLVTAILSPQNSEALGIIETQNDDFVWFQNLRNLTKNPLGKYVASLSKQWTHRFMEAHEKDFIFLHLTTIDDAGYKRFYPNHESVVVTAGIDVKDKLTFQTQDKKLKLIFVGSLDVNMNFDALVHFKEQFFPQFKATFGENMAIMVVGSRPPTHVKALCKEMNWPLYADVSDRELTEKYQTATFAILPFAYSTGIKLKFREAFSNGIPVLATTPVGSPFQTNLPHCLVSDDPTDWVKQAQKTMAKGIAEAERNVLLTEAHRYSWDALAQELFDKLSAP